MLADNAYTLPPIQLLHQKIPNSRTRELPGGAADGAETDHREGRATASPEGSDPAAIPL